MSKRVRYSMVALCVLVAIGAGVAAGLGAFARGDGSSAVAVSIRGEQYRYMTSGIYAFNSQRLVAEGVGWDWFTLFAVVPALLIVTPALARGSLRGRLLAIGLLGYVFYQYLMYALSYAISPLFPLFIALYSAGLFGGIWIATTIGLDGLPERFGPSFPRRSLAVVCVLLGAALVLMWSVRIGSALRGDFAGAMLLGMPTLVVQALDLGLIVPLGFITAALVWTRRPFGYLLGPVFAIKGVAMAAAICAMLVSAWMVEGKPDVVGFAIFGAGLAALVVIAVRIFTSITEPEPGHEGPALAAPSGPAVPAS